MKKILALLLVCLLLAGCGKQAPAEQEETQTATEPAMSAEDVALLQSRRDAAESYMRDMATVLWRATEDLTWTTDSSLETEEDLAAYCEEKTPMVIKAGRLYRGVPYSFSGAPAGSFYQFLGENDEKGYPMVNGLHWRSLNGTSSGTGRIGNDCSSAVQQTWESVGGNFIPASTEFMVPSYGYIPVGDYENKETSYTNTVDIANANGGDVMFAAYAQLQKADAVVRRKDGAGHTMMVTSVNVVYNADGSIDGINSYITVLHQTSSYLKKEACTYDETIGEDVYKVYGIDDKYTFMKLLGDGYLPITCDVLVNPDATLKEAWFKDSETEFTKDNIFGGEITSNSMMAYMTITITDSKGNEVAQQTAFCRRQTKKDVITFPMVNFETEEAFNTLGELDLTTLKPGTYHCTHVLTDAHGGEHVMRDFDFTV